MTPRRPTSISARLARLVLVLALLGAWQVALVHPIAHVDQDGALLHVPGSHGKQAGAACDALAALTACLGSSFTPLSLAGISEAGAAGVFAAPRAGEAPPFLAQGPPPIL